MKCSRCFKSLPEVEWYDWDVDERGSVKHRHLHQHPCYTCLTCNKNYCIACWIKQQCADMVFGD